MEIFQTSDGHVARNSINKFDLCQHAKRNKDVFNYNEYFPEGVGKSEKFPRDNSQGKNESDALQILRKYLFNWGIHTNPHWTRVVGCGPYLCE
jgi:hypothetical protein